jgi:hypothetical protein
MDGDTVGLRDKDGDAVGLRDRDGWADTLGEDVGETVGSPVTVKSNTSLKRSSVITSARRFLFLSFR